MHIILAFVAISLLGTIATAQSDVPTSGNLLEDARRIITSDKGDVRVWAHPPRMLVLSDDRTQRHVESIVGTLEAAIASPFGETFWGEILYHRVPQDIGAGQQRIWARMRKGGPSGHQVELNLGDDLVFTTDILLIVADRQTVAVLNGLWGLSPKHSRAQLQGGMARCYYSSRSRNGMRLGAYVTIFQAPDPDFIEECLWEELLHSLGPLMDAEGSEFFSFDNQLDRQGNLPEPEQNARTKRKRANDLALLRALYESGAGPGGSPDRVLEYLQQIIP